jgi:hypothetical protein
MHAVSRSRHNPVVPSNLDLVRSICEAWERGDFHLVEWAHPEMEYVMVDGPSPGSHKGLAEVAKAERQFLSPFLDYRLDAQEYRELDADRILVLTESAGRGKASGVDFGALRARAAVLFEISAGQVTKLVVYFSRERAFGDLDLTPDALDE